MSLVKHRITALEIHFKTLTVPPPFSHAYHIRIALEAEQPATSFEIHYTEREQLSEEEILEEGFTAEDDFQWEGSLPKTWKFATLDQLRKSKQLFDTPKPHTQQVLSLTVTYENGEQVSGIPNNPETWEYFTQEMIQAIYELGQKEMPLEVTHLEINSKEQIQLTIQPSFSMRNIRVTSNTAGQKKQQEHDWDRLKPLLEAIYLPDYDAEQASEKEPKKPGSYISPGDGLWYKLGKAVTNPGEKKDVVGALEQSIKALIS